MALEAVSLLRGLAVMVMVLAMAVGRVDSLATTDTITWGGDNSRSGYFPNNNMDPAVVASNDFGQVFKVQLPGNYNGEKERIFSQPLIYTPKGGDGTQYVYWATAQNNVYKMNAKTGEILASRNLHIPFMSQDLKGENQETPGYCQDINPVVGIIGTGVIDPDTDTLYLSSKTYVDQTRIGVPQGRPAGRVFIHALNVNDLSERPNFPINLEGLRPRNNPDRTFNGGIQNQRPGLLHPKGSDFIYAGYGSHCVNYNFTGYVIGWHKTTGEIVERFATQGEGVESPKKGASLWMSGGGIASDDRGSMFFATGNGYSGQVKDIPITSGTPPTSLEEAVVHMTYNGSGSTTVVDFFMPANKGYLDGGDLDLGTSPLAILPGDPFSCGGVKRMGVVTGKDGTTWFLNLDDLGGYRTGENRGNRVIGSFLNENSVYAGVGVYPLDGGYVYVNVIGFKSHVFKFNCVNGVPAFTKVADSPAGKNGFGVSHGAVTSLKGQSGTGLFWVTDVDNAVPEKWSFRIYEAVPTGAGGTVMRILKGFAVSAINKFTRPQFGDGIVYFGTSQGLVYAFGAPTNPALDCSTVDDFGTVDIGLEAAEQTITCTPKGALTVSGLTLESADFSVAGVPTFPKSLDAQSSFTFTAKFKPTKVGSLSGNIVIKTANSVSGFATSTSVRLRGTGESANALLTVSPQTVAIGLVAVGTEPISNTVVLANDGMTALNIQSVQYSQAGPDGPFVTPTNTDTTVKVGAYTLTNIPSILAAHSQQLVTVTFNPATVGNSNLYVKIVSDGGEAGIAVTASVGKSPTALLQLEKPDGSGWQTWSPSSNAPLSFGKVTQNNNRRLRFRITNTAPAGSVPLQIPISKPPFGVPGLINTANQVDLGEGSNIPAGEFLEAIIVCTAPKAQWNTDAYTNVAGWVINTNDATLGKVEVPFTCTAVAQQGGPLDNGQGLYRYVGCFRENNPGRQLKQQLYGNNNNSADMCLQACAAKGFAYCGAEYHRECWGGPTPPVQQVPDVNCNFDCSGDINQYCGGDGTGATAGNAHISLWATNKTLPDVPGSSSGPYVNPGLNGYASIGCYTEVAGRALPNGVSTGNVRTVAACINACSKLSYKYIGLEYGGECWCGNDIRQPSLPTAIGECSVTCRDNSTEYCGGGSRLNVYQRSPISGNDVSSTSSNLFTISSSSTVVSGSSTSTLVSSSAEQSSSFSTSSAISSSASSADSSSSTSAISSSSLSLSSSSSSSEVVVSTSTSTSSLATTSTSTTSSASPSSTVPAIKRTVGAYRYQGCYTETTQGGRSLNGKSYFNDTMTLEACAAACSAFTYWGAEYGRECYCGNEPRGNTALDVETKCSFLCPGDKMTFCGAGSRLSLYKYDPSLNQTVASTTTSSASVVGFDESSTSSISSTSSASTTSSASDTSSASSILSTSSEISTASSTSTTSSTSSSSSSAAQSTSSESTSSTASATASELSSTTSTSTSTTKSSTSTTSTSPSATVSPPLWPGNANFTYYGCVAEPSNGRLLTKLMFGADDATHDKCLEACWMYAYAGVEYGRECWCGNGPINWNGTTGATPGFNTTESECKMNCAGDAKRKCGASKRITLFYFDTEKSSKKAS